MRKLFLGVAMATVLAFGGSAFAQSQQGGYLGQNPSGHQTATLAAPTHPGSGQGGYLGIDPGARLAPAPKPAGNMAGNMMSDPMAWCSSSPEPSRCRARAAIEHPMCLEHPEHYAACRFAMDQMHPY